MAQPMTAEDAEHAKYAAEMGIGLSVNASCAKRIAATYAECERLRAQLAAAREDSKRLLCDADSYLSLLYSRYVRKHEVPLDVRIEVESVIGRLRESYKNAALDTARSTDAERRGTE